MREQGRLNYRWIIVGISFVNLGLSAAIWYSFSVFFVALLREFGWSRSVCAGAFSLFVILHSFVGPFIGSMVDRFGPRRVIALGSLALGAGLFLCSLTRTWWQFYIFFGVITGIGAGSTGWVTHSTLIQNWFTEGRGLATGIIASGLGIGILIYTPLVQYFIDLVGWRMTYRIMAVSIPLIVLSMTLLFLRKSPPPSPARSVEKEYFHLTDKDPPVANEVCRSRSWTVWQAMTTRLFWLLSLCFMLGTFSTQSVLTHQVVFFVDKGLEARFASYIVGMVGLVSMGGKILWGTLSDRIGREWTYTLGSFSSIFGLISLIAFHFFRPNHPLLVCVLYRPGIVVALPRDASDVFG
jgi:MFS family permease